VSVRLGVVFPQTEIGADPGAIRAFAQAVEAAGFDHLVFYDHVVGVDSIARPGWAEMAHRDGATSAKPYDVDDAFHEVMVMMGFLAGVCTLELCTGILVLPQRQTALVAKQAAEVDVLSGGRLRLGVGVGWNRLEFEALGADFDQRAQRLEAQIDLLRRYWTMRSVDHEGVDGYAHGVGLAPASVQRPIPIWLAAGRSRALERVGRIADGWLPVSVEPANLGPALDVVRRSAERAGRDPAGIGIEGRLPTSGGADMAWIVAQYRNWKDLGASHVALNTMGSGLRSADDHVAMLEQVMDALRGDGE
jgi:probable F420-dependent oxidoreductase